MRHNTLRYDLTITEHVKDIQSICEKIVKRETAIEWINDATEITKICKYIVDYSAEVAMKYNPEQVELNL